MPAISKLRSITHHQLDGVTIYPLQECLHTGQAQEVLVHVEPRADIPLHTHETQAKMFIVAGDGTVLSADPNLNGQFVQRGDLVLFEARISHGFRAGNQGLSFVSRNGGIVADQGDWDIEFE